jgi:hypothetical protein
MRPVGVFRFDSLRSLNPREWAWGVRAALHVKRGRAAEQGSDPWDSSVSTRFARSRRGRGGAGGKAGVSRETRARRRATMHAVRPGRFDSLCSLNERE